MTFSFWTVTCNLWLVAVGFYVLRLYDERNPSRGIFVAPRMVELGKLLIASYWPIVRIVNGGTCCFYVTFN